MGKMTNIVVTVIGMVVLLIGSMYFLVDKKSDVERAEIDLFNELGTYHEKGESVFREHQDVQNIRFSKSHAMTEDEEDKEIMFVKTDIGELNFLVEEVKFKLGTVYEPRLEFTVRDFEDIPYENLLNNENIVENYIKYTDGIELKDTLSKLEEDMNAKEKEFMSKIRSHKEYYKVEVLLPSAMYQQYKEDGYIN